MTGEIAVRIINDTDWTSANTVAVIAVAISIVTTVIAWRQRKKEVSLENKKKAYMEIVIGVAEACYRHKESGVFNNVNIATQILQVQRANAEIWGSEQVKAGYYKIQDAIQRNDKNEYGFYLDEFIAIVRSELADAKRQHLFTLRKKRQNTKNSSREEGKNTDS